MTDYDAIVVGAGHNGLTAAAILQGAGLRTLCLEANTYSGGMAATVELIDGFRYEIAGSVQFPTAPQITKELGLDTLPTVDAEVMSVNIGESGEEPMIFYRDPMQLMTHLGEKHGADAIMGMAELIGWSQGPAKALGRFEVRTPPKTLDQMYSCAATKPNVRPSIRCCSARRWTPSTATCRTRKSTQSCAGCWRFWPSTPPIAARTRPAVPLAWPLRWRCPTTAPR